MPECNHRSPNEMIATDLPLRRGQRGEGESERERERRGGVVVRSPPV
jgi:hypothetical protein